MPLRRKKPAEAFSGTPEQFRSLEDEVNRLRQQLSEERDALEAKLAKAQEGENAARRSLALERQLHEGERSEYATKIGALSVRVDEMAQELERLRQAPPPPTNAGRGSRDPMVG